MTTYVPAKVNTQFIFYGSLVSQADTKLLKSNPTIASGDFKSSLDGGAFGNLGTLPTVTPASGVGVKFTLSTSEMNGANVLVTAIDASGAEWCDASWNFQTAARQVDDLMYPATSGRSTVVDANGLVDALMVKVGPTGSGTAQTAGDIPARLPTALVGGRMDSSIGAVVNGVIVAASFAANALDAVWSTATRLLTAGTNIVLAKGVGVTGFNDLDAAGVRTAVGLASANLDTQLAAIAGYIDTEVASILAAVDTEVASILTAVTAIKVTTDKFAFTTANQVDSQVLSAAANTINASALATDAVNEIRDAIIAKVLVELTGVPSATPTVGEALTYLFMALRNRRETTATSDKVENDAGTAIGTAVLSDDGTTFTKGKYA